jgi:hypothetical protein
MAGTLSPAGLPGYPEPMQLTTARAFTITISLLMVLELITCRLYRGPEVVPDDGIRSEESLPAGTRFSAERARIIHQQLFPNVPHPVGSRENEAVRDRLVSMLQQHGWQVDIQRVDASVPGDDGETVTLFNVLAYRAEQNDLNAKPLVLTTHYDSCRFGPGAGDAGACVAAVVESGRLLTQDITTLRRPLLLLFTDGEEAGLLGAAALVKSHPLSQRKPWFLNFDARGTKGPVVMYETHANNCSAVEEWINSLARPRITGSLFAAIYRMLPNGTDFTEFRNAGWQGFNFAIIDGAHRYHQPDDTLENLDLRSLQHFGNHAMSVAEKIVHSELELPDADENAVFFDVLGQIVVHYPIRWSFYLRFALLITAVQLYGRQALRRETLRSSAAVWLTMLLIIVANATLGWVISESLSDTVVLPRRFVWYGHGLSFLMWCVSLIVSCSIARGKLWRIEQATVWNAFWLGQAMTNLVVSIVAPEFSHLLAIPGLIAVLLTFTVKPIVWRTILSITAAGVMLIPVQHLLAIALGPAGGLMLFPMFSLIAMPMLPLFGRSVQSSRPPDAVCVT